MTSIPTYQHHSQESKSASAMLSTPLSFAANIVNSIYTSTANADEYLNLQTPLSNKFLAPTRNIDEYQNLESPKTVQVGQIETFASTYQNSADNFSSYSSDPNYNNNNNKVTSSFDASYNGYQDLSVRSKDFEFSEAFSEGRNRKKRKEGKKKKSLASDFANACRPALMVNKEKRDVEVDSGKKDK